MMSSSAHPPSKMISMHAHIFHIVLVYVFMFVCSFIYKLGLSNCISDFLGIGKLPVSLDGISHFTSKSHPVKVFSDFKSYKQHMLIITGFGCSTVPSIQ